MNNSTVCLTILVNEQDLAAFREQAARASLPLDRWLERVAIRRSWHVMVEYQRVWASADVEPLPGAKRFEFQVSDSAFHSLSDAASMTYRYDGEAYHRFDVAQFVVASARRAVRGDGASWRQA